MDKSWVVGQRNEQLRPGREISEVWMWMGPWHKVEVQTDGPEKLSATGNVQQVLKWERQEMLSKAKQQTDLSYRMDEIANWDKDLKKKSNKAYKGYS